MNEDEVMQVPQVNEEMLDLVQELLDKADKTIEKSVDSSNVVFDVDGFSVPLRVDDHQLLYIGATLLPNILNYLVNILPQFIYPYIVAYLQDLSALRENDPFTIKELYDLIRDKKDK